MCPSTGRNGIPSHLLNPVDEDCQSHIHASRVENGYEKPTRHWRSDSADADTCLPSQPLIRTLIGPLVRMIPFQGGLPANVCSVVYSELINQPGKTDTAVGAERCHCSSSDLVKSTSQTRILLFGQHSLALRNVCGSSEIHRQTEEKETTLLE